MDPDLVVREMQALLDRSGIDDSLRYPVSVLLLAREVRNWMQAPQPPERVDELMSELVAEIQRWTASSRVPLTVVPKPAP